jgi:hypothetical protein
MWTTEADMLLKTKATEKNQSHRMSYVDENK